MSGEDTYQTVARAVEAGFAGHLVKPVTREAICAQVHRAVRCCVYPARSGRRMPLSDLTGLSVLVVEDHEDSREALSLWLKHLGARVTSAEGGADALTFLATGPPPDVLIFDIHLPDMDGCELLLRLRATSAFRDVPAIAVTGDPSQWERMTKAGFDAQLLKPVLGSSVADVISRVLAR
jgi:CheY-like chemotaxis protein